MQKEAISLLMWLLASVVTWRKTKVELSDSEGQDPRILRNRNVVAQESTIYLSFAIQQGPQNYVTVSLGFSIIGTLGFVSLFLHGCPQNSRDNSYPDLLSTQKITHLQIPRHLEESTSWKTRLTRTEADWEEPSHNYRRKKGGDMWILEPSLCQALCLLLYAHVLI